MITLNSKTTLSLHKRDRDFFHKEEISERCSGVLSVLLLLHSHWWQCSRYALHLILLCYLVNGLLGVLYFICLFIHFFVSISTFIILYYKVTLINRKAWLGSATFLGQSLSVVGYLGTYQAS